MELELKHIAPYLPYGLKWVVNGSNHANFTTIGITGENIYTNEGHVLNWKKYDGFTQVLFPLLRPLSSLDTHELIVDLGGEVSDAIFDWCSYFNSDNQNKDAAILCAPFPVIEWCCKNHIDIFSLIDKGLAIAIED